MEQQWDPVVINGNAGRGKKKRIPAGAEVETVRKYNAGGNRQRAGPNARRLEDDDEDGPPKVQTVKVSVARRIQQGRQAKGWTQKQLAQAINEKPTVVNDYENGRAVPNNQILGKMERALGTKIRGK